ncbi:MAG: GTP-binding protein [Patescibacteria group bacterium]|nr:GTP-binding protein [Patescibacteria group bacterium]
MNTIHEQIQALEEEIRKTPYHKGTEQHIGLLRAKIARLKDKQIEELSRKSGGGGGYAVKKQGDATVVLIGPPSVGKSTLLNALTNAKSKVAPYAFTTVTVIPGMMKHKDAYIQILDVPGLIEGAEEGKGRGREVLSVARGCDMAIIISDAKNEKSYESISNALHKNGIRLNQKPPDVLIDKKMNGGVNIKSNFRLSISKDVICQFANEFGIKNADIVINEVINLDRLIDAFSPNRVYMPAIYVLNKVDIMPPSQEIVRKYDPVPISAENKLNLDILRDKIWDTLNFARVYLVKPDCEPNFDQQLILKKGSALQDVLNKLGSEFKATKTSAKIWGSGAKFGGQEVSLSYKISDGMQIRFI